MYVLELIFEYNNDFKISFTVRILHINSEKLKLFQETFLPSIILSGFKRG